jgi:hypothetical protein
VKNKPHRLPDGLFSWIAPTLFYPEDDILKTAGMDAVVMTRLLMYGESLELAGGRVDTRRGGCMHTGIGCSSSWPQPASRLMRAVSSQIIPTHPDGCCAVVA